MRNWKSETGKYLNRLDKLSILFSKRPTKPANIPDWPLDSAPTEIQTVIQWSVVTYKVGVWERTRETLDAILCLWREGLLCEAASLSRQLFEIWGISNYQTQSLINYTTEENLLKLTKTISKIFQGVRTEVLMPWGIPAGETPIHVMDTTRSLREEYPTAIETYDDLCESAHANQPRYFEWWFLGKYGDNWTNKTVQIRGHDLLGRTISSIEHCVIRNKFISNKRTKFMWSTLLKTPNTPLHYNSSPRLRRAVADRGLSL